MNITAFPSAFPNESSLYHRKKYAWYIVAAGGCLLLATMTLFIYLYFTNKKSRQRNMSIDYRSRPLPSLPSSELVRDVITQSTFDINADYLRPNSRGIENCPVRPKRDFPNYSNRILEENMEERCTENAPQLPARDFSLYLNNVMKKVDKESKLQNLTSSININGNIQQLNIVHKSGIVNIAGVNCGNRENNKQQARSS